MENIKFNEREGLKINILNRFKMAGALSFKWAGQKSENLVVKAATSEKTLST